MALAHPIRDTTIPADQASDTRRQLPTPLPAGWENLWRATRSDLKLIVDNLRQQNEELALDIPAFDERERLHNLVSGIEMSSAPVHRWYAYKEGFSPQLPHVLLRLLPVNTIQTVGDVFAGVATTQLTLQFAEHVTKTVGVEYSPFAHFVGKTKLRWSELDPKRLGRSAERLAKFRLSSSRLPELTAFHDERIFSPSVARALISARDSICTDDKLTEIERDCLLLGLANVVEDVSGAMKDGRALRIVNGRRRTFKALKPRGNTSNSSDFRAILMNQWLAMVEDLQEMAPMRAHIKTTSRHHLGDARQITKIAARSKLIIPETSIDALIYSPPYLNCIDYTEVYKLELWLLEFICDQTQFRNLRLGTLRSHPSVEFPATSHFHSHESAAVVQTILNLATFVEEHHSRANMGRMVKNYFEDMFASFREQIKVLRPGGVIACVVANSTFSRRNNTATGRQEDWSLPIASDILLAKLAELAGFESVEIWDARALRPRNVKNGAARESVVVAVKPTS